MLICNTGFTKTYIYSARSNFEDIDSFIRTEVDNTSAEFYKELQKSYDKEFQKYSNQAQRFGFVTNSKTHFNFSHFYSGQQQTLIDGKMIKLPSSNMSDIKLNLVQPVALTVRLRPLLQDYKLSLLDYEDTLQVNENRFLHKNLLLSYTPTGPDLFTSF